MLGIIVSAFILCACIKVFTDDETGFGSAVIASLIASVVGRILGAVACAPIESVVLQMIVSLAISFVVTAIAVQFLCSTDLAGLLKITGLYIAINLVFELILVFAVGSLTAT